MDSPWYCTCYVKNTYFLGRFLLKDISQIIAFGALESKDQPRFFLSGNGSVRDYPTRGCARDCDYALHYFQLLRANVLDDYVDGHLISNFNNNKNGYFDVDFNQGDVRQ